MILGDFLVRGVEFVLLLVYRRLLLDRLDLAVDLLARLVERVAVVLRGLGLLGLVVVFVARGVAGAGDASLFAALARRLRRPSGTPRFINAARRYPPNTSLK